MTFFDRFFILNINFRKKSKYQFTNLKLLFIQLEQTFVIYVTSLNINSRVRIK